MKWRSSSLKRRFFVRTLLWIAVPFLITVTLLGLTTIFIAERYTRNEIETNQGNVLLQFNEFLQVMSSELDSLSLHFEQNPKISLTLKGILSSDSLTYEQLESLFYIKNMIDVPTNSKPYIHSIYLYADNDKGRFLISREGLVQFDHYADLSWHTSYTSGILRGNSDIVTEVRSYPHFYKDQRISLISLYKPLYFSGSKEQTGMIVMNLYPEYFEAYIRNIVHLPGNSFYILDRNGEVLIRHLDENHPAEDLLQYADAEALLAIGKAREIGPYYAAVSTNSRLGWVTVTAALSDELFRLPRMLVGTMFVTLALLIVGIVCGAYYITIKNYRRIEGIVRLLENADDSALDQWSKHQTVDLYGYIMNNIIRTFIEQRYLKIQLSERSYHMQVLQFKALQSQINPHFIRNTLNSVYWNAYRLTNSPNQACHMISLLQDVLTYSIQSSTDTVPLWQELQYTDRFIAIMKHRYGQSLQYTLDCPDDLQAQVKVPKCLFQPFLENSIQHGWGDRARLRVRIRIVSRPDRIGIAITDNGIGIAGNKLAEIRQKLQSGDDSQRHIGLFNTRNRILLQYGPSADLTIRSRQGLGTWVQITLPANRETIRSAEAE